MKISFGSDNFSPVHPRIMQALAEANLGHVKSYGADAYTRRAESMFRDRFGKDSAVFFVFNGTAANILSMRGFLEPFSAVLCSDSAHIHCDEGGAPEQILGCKLITVPNEQGKVSCEDLEKWMSWQENEHHSQPRLVSIAQCTELGTVYRPDEIQKLVDFAHRHNMFVHVDGARLANALAHLGCSVKELLVDTGVDVVSFGGTKNGMMFGEAVVFPDAKMASRFKFYRKNMAQLYSKMRFLAAQFCAFLEDDFWIKNAQHANNMASLLGRGLSAIPCVEIVAPVEANGVFAKIPKKAIEALQQESFFYVWNEQESVVRFMVSFDVEEADVQRFVYRAREIFAQI